MYPYDYADFLQLHLSSDAAFDYDFDAHIAQCANVFGTEEKGCLDEHHGPPIPIILSGSDVFGSPYSSSSSRSSSIANGSIKSEDLDCEGAVPAAPTSPLSRTQTKRNERIRMFDGPQVVHQPSPRPSSPPTLQRTRTSKTPTNIIPPSVCPVPKAPVPELSFYSRKRRRRPISPPARLSDEDVDGESDNDTDDEYIPTPRSGGVKRRRTSHNPTHRSASLIRSSSPSPAPIKRVPGTCHSRNKQAISAAAINRACHATDLSFVCPECGWKQANKRLPDFKRHLRTHTRPNDSDQSKGWWCKGVLLEEAHKFNVPKDAKSYTFLGQERIGGCMQTFSRRDALKRHLDNVNVTCIGRPSEAIEG